jgi:hypothetical protein
MDTVQGELSGHDDPAVAPASGGTTGTAPMPSPDERRMQVRAYNFWAGLLADGTFPLITALDPQALPDFGPRSVLLDFSDGIENPQIAWLGSLLAQECGAVDTIVRLEDVPSRSLLSRITDHYMQILANEAPIGFEAEFVNHLGVTILYRGILLPFSRDGKRIDFIYGVINWKEHSGDAPVRRPAPDDEPPAMLRAPEPLTDWADGPADIGPTDYGLQPLEGYAPLELPRPGFAFEDEPTALADTTMGLADWVASARELAMLATHSEERSHQALYDAIGRAYDCALAAEDSPEDFAELVEDAGLKAQQRAPLIPLVKLVFGADYDKTRLTEFATVIGHGRRIGLARGALAGHLAAAPGGLKALVREERRLRREGGPAKAPTTARQRLAEDLRAIASRPLADLAREGEEFTVLVARRLANGEVVLLGEVGDDDALLQRAAKRLLG